jgi:rod shape-determining protein MreD
MTKEIIRFACLFVFLVLCQVVVFNHICLFGVAIPLVFIYFIIKLPITIGINRMMTLAFLIGLVVDVFSNTQGMNALACTVLSVLRSSCLKLYLSRQDDLSNPVPSIRTLGLAVFMKYALTMSAVYCFLFFVIEAFSFFDILQLLMRVVFSALLTFVIILAFDSISSANR